MISFLRSGVHSYGMREDIRPGASFPDYELPDQTGRKRKLSDLQQDDPMIVHLSRGDF